MEENPIVTKSGEWQRTPPPSPAWKAYVAPGVLFTIIGLTTGWLGSYAQKKNDEGAQQNHTIEQDRRIEAGEKDRQDLRLRLEQCVQKVDYNREVERQTKQLDRISDNVDKMRR